MASPSRSFIDQALGGLEPGFPTILTGPTGSGRTVLCLELAHAALARGESVAYLTGEPAPLLLRQASALELELRAEIRSGQLALFELDPDVATATRHHGGEPLYEALISACPEAKLLIIDPLDALTTEILDEVSLRTMVRAVFDGAARSQQLLVGTVDSSILEENLPLARVLKGACGSFVELSHSDEEGTHVLRVAKSRAAGSVSGNLRFCIGPGGPTRCAAGESGVSANADLARSSDTAASEQRERPVLLIVDDNRLAREMMCDFLADQYEIVTAEDGFSAIKMVLSHDPDLVILDLHLPRVSGFEVLGALQEGGATVPVLVVSGMLARATDRLRVLVLGATDMLRKPVEKFELRLKVESLLQQTRRDARRGEQPLFDCDDVEALLGGGAAACSLDEPRFIERVGRTCCFGEDYGLNSVLVPFETVSAAHHKQLLKAAKETLRAEDAVLSLPDGRRGMLLLVATQAELVELILGRIAAQIPETAKRNHANRYAICPAEPLDEIKDWDGYFGDLIPWPASAK